MPTFTRQERLKSRKIIARLFKGGNSFVAYPLRVVWLLAEHDERTETSTTMAEISGIAQEISVQVAISVPKKSFKTAVARNLLKRRIREAYRLHKHDLYEKLAGHSVALMLMFVAKEELTFAEIEKGMQKMIKKWPAMPTP